MLSVLCTRPTAALLLTREFPLESPCKDSAFLAFFLRNFWSIFFLNSVGGTLVTTDVTSHVRPQAFHGWLLSCCVPARLREASPLLAGPVPRCACPESVAPAAIPGCPAADPVCNEELEGREGAAGAGLRCWHCQECRPSALALRSAAFLCGLKNCEIYRGKNGQASFLRTSSAILQTLGAPK